MTRNSLVLALAMLLAAGLVMMPGELRAQSDTLRFGLVKDINPGTDQYGTVYEGNPSYPKVIGNTLYFRAQDQDFNYEPWTSDGTPEGTTILKELNASGSSDPEQFLELGGMVYFQTVVAHYGHNGAFWRTDGTAGGTQQVMSQLYFTESVATDNYLFLAADSTADDGDDREVWLFDGTGQPYPLTPGAVEPGSSQPEQLTALGDMVVYNAYDSNDEEELFAADADTAWKLKDISASGGSYPSGFERVGQKVYFNADDGSVGSELWVTDGTTGGTQLVANIAEDTSYARHSQPGDLTGHEGKLYFSAADKYGDRALWVSDGTPAGTMQLAEIMPGVPSGAGVQIGEMTSVGSQVFFSADDGTHGKELWVTDGTSGGTHLVKDIWPGSGEGNPRDLTAWGDTLLFIAWDGSTGYEPYMSDGTLAGTKRIADLNSDAGDYGGLDQNSSELDWLGTVNGYPLAAATNGTTGVELWRLEVEQAPSGFARIAPGDGSVINAPNDSVFAFSWEDSHDPNLGQTVHYLLRQEVDLGRDGVDTVRTVTTADTLDSLRLADALGMTSWSDTVEVQWTVRSVSGEDTVHAGGGGQWTALIVPDTEPQVDINLVSPEYDRVVSYADPIVFIWAYSDDQDSEAEEYLLDLDVTHKTLKDTSFTVDGLHDTTVAVDIPDTLGVSTWDDTLHVDWQVRAIEGSDTNTSYQKWTVHLVHPTSGVEQQQALPRDFAVREVYPNPFNPRVTVALDVPEAADVRAVIYNVLGRKVATLAQGRMAAGSHRLTWRPDGLTSGIYFLRVTAGEDFRDVRRLVFMK